MLRHSGESRYCGETEFKRQELGGIFDGSRRSVPQVPISLCSVLHYLIPGVSQLLEHLRKFPVSATGGLMLAKYVSDVRAPRTV
jgi:hypothetical protein